MPNTSRIPAELRPNSGRKPADRAVYGRSRTCNDFLALRGIDGRTFWGRRRREILTRLAERVKALRPLGEEDHLHLNAATVLSLRIEQMEVAVTNGETIDDEQLLRLTNGLTRVIKQLGLKPSRP